MRAVSWKAHLAWLVTVCVVSAATWWATSAVLRPPQAELGSVQQPAVVVAETGTVGARQTVLATVAYAPAETVVARAGGTVTSLDAPHGTAGSLAAGDVLLSLDLRPVVLLEGSTPMFRDLVPGTRGPDIAQLRRFLRLDVGDLYDAATEAAVRAWQEELGLPPTGTVQRGDVAFLPDLPVEAMVSPELHLGAQVSPGQVLLQSFTPVPTITMVDDGLITAGSPGHLQEHEGVSGTLEPAGTDEQGLALLGLQVAKGEQLCDDACRLAYPAPGPHETQLVVETVPETEGVVVPEAAVLYSSVGDAVVVAEDGSRVVVEVLAAADGVVAVSGLEPGTVVQLFPEDTP